MLSVVVPTLNESSRIGTLVASLGGVVDEVVVADGGSTDATCAIASQAGAKVVSGPRGRGLQMDHGAVHARGDVLWFLHADVEVPSSLVRAVRRAAESFRWGACQVEIASADPILSWTAFVMNHRAARTGVMTGDMGIWMRRRFFDSLGGFGGLTICEDLALSDRAREVSRWKLVRPPLRLASRRWEREGVGRTALRMWLVRAAYRAGAPQAWLARRYASDPR